MHLKKSLLGAYETAFKSKELQMELLIDGKPANPDVIASGVKETLELLNNGQHKEKEVTLILPQESFSFFREDMPVDITEQVLDSYLREKAKTVLKVDIDSVKYDYIIRESEGKKKILFYAISQDTIQSFAEPLNLIELSLQNIIPESLTYFKLFEKTLRANKKENIWYVSYDHNQLSGYAFDSYGLLEGKRWIAPIADDNKIEKVLQKQASTYTAQNIKLNRLILSGGQSDDVRQDTFTKDVGVWTNPLKRIIPHFYADYVKMLSGQENTEIPVLKYDMLVGAFILSQENKSFSLLKKSNGGGGGGNTISKPQFKAPSFAMPSVHLPVKGLLFFFVSFVVTFAVLYGISQVMSGTHQFSLPSFSLPAFMAQATPTPTVTPTPQPPTPTPTPEITREEIRVKVLNGSGIAGKAGVVKAFLTEAGYGEILTENADSFDYETTVIRTKEDDDAIRDLISEDISSEVEGELEYETLGEDAAADVEIIVGTDFR